jgi:hypothetical protein
VRKTADRIELEPYDWPQRRCESFACLHRALWRIKFHCEDADLLVGEDKETLLACAQHAQNIVWDAQQAGDLVIFYNKELH